MSTEKLRLIPGYKLRVIDLLHGVEIADDFTLGELCLMIRDCKEMDLRTLSALIHCPLAPFLEECLGPGSRTTRSQPLSSIHVSWQCEYDNSSETRWPPETMLWLDVCGVGDLWEDYQPGGQWYEEGKEVAGCNTYALELTPLHELRHLPLRIDPTMRIACTDDPGKAPLEIPAPEVTLLQLTHALFWEFSFFDTSEQRDAQSTALQESVRRIEAGEVKLIPWEEVQKEFGELRDGLQRRSRSTRTE